VEASGRAARVDPLREVEAEQERGGDETTSCVDRGEEESERAASERAGGVGSGGRGWRSNEEASESVKGDRLGAGGRRARA
jgi:hypothetical protein